ncbi:SAM-dependent methyltransferase [Streptomyces sp. NBC_01275]|uniref:SAM-dependent methyltransferase n=1 Tax=Streptomyces sp. NBC_01275 TaxID=2903807 RepID=UPI002252003A|nr:SAM-dependent methyltransferase [Streptomyces sp. NBC_01275]MCX4763961.1 SAM-dependent methyltransferase [Streptomyces sp. NBC_01275]
MTADPSWITEEVDADQPSIARLYDYLLGGTHNVESDRKLAREAMRAAPGLLKLVRENRSFLRRAVRHAVDAGIDQFLDLGSGIPTRGSVHQTAQALNPEARVAYVDIDPVAVAHGRRLLADNDRATAVQGSLLEPEAVFDSPEIRSVIDFDRPVALLFLSVLHFFSDDKVLPALKVYRDKVAPGSHLVFSVATNAENDDAADMVRSIYADAWADCVMRSRDEAALLLGDFTVLPPGIVFPVYWESGIPLGTETNPVHHNYFVGVGRKPE